MRKSDWCDSEEKRVVGQVCGPQKWDRLTPNRCKFGLVDFSSSQRQSHDYINIIKHCLFIKCIPFPRFIFSLTTTFSTSRLTLLRPVLLAGRDGEQRWFGGRRNLDCSAPRVWWLHTPLCGKAEAQGTRPSKPEKKGTLPIGNSRGIAVQVRRLLSGSGKALDTFLCPLHELGLVEGGRM